jgi:chromosome segregation protein
LRIRSLEITGFKSFADRTVMAFDHGISAIVGPNGCGKSNVVDAVRWVMGEQNPRHLRGRLMEDIIFGGTESRPAVGMAEVVLTFDNSDGRASAAYAGFTEIQIARRLYRSGESEYLINKVPCRLRDVLDFFLDTGVGVRGYTIVEQGQIAAIVSNRPTDRRVIFEEAAGIGKYRQRRQETERKLLATEQNLLRVTDIIGELRRQISSLERQARKARRYKELSAKVRDLELVVTWEEYQADAGRLEEVEREHNNLLAGVVAIDAQIARTEANLEAEQHHHLDREKELQNTSEALYSIRSEIHSLENRLEYERREREGLVRLADERQNEVEELETQLSANSSALTEVVEELSCLDERQETERSQLGAREQALGEETDRVAAMQGRREAMQAQLANLSAESATLESRAEAFGERRRELELRLRQTDETLDGKAVEFEALRQDELAIETRLRGALAEKDDLGRSLGDVLRANQQSGAALEKLRSDLVSHREKLQQTATRLESLQEADREGSSRLSEILKKMAPERRQRVRGILSDVLRVQEGFEAAVEAVLGERLEAVLVDDSTSALDLLAWLGKEALGRATLLPVLPGAEDARGFVPLGRPLLDVVRPAEHFRPLAQRLLRDVYLVDDLADPIARFGIQDPLAVFVTPGGEVLDRSGALTGGMRAPPGPVSRSSEIRRLEQELQVLQSRSSELEAATAAEAQRLAELGTEVENTRNRHHTAELAVVNLEKDLERIRERAKEAVEYLESQRQLKEQLGSQIERVTHESAEVASRVDVIAQERSEVGSRHEEVSAEAADLGREVDKLERRLVQYRIELAELGARREQLRETEERLRNAVREGREWLSRRREEIQGARDRSAELGRSTEEAALLLQRKIEEEEGIRQTQERLREGYEVSQRKVDEAQAGVRAAVSARDATREKLSSSELALQEARLRRNQVVERILERYGIDLASYRPPPEHLTGESDSRQAELTRIRSSLDSLGDVHLGAIEEYEEVSERYRYLGEQKADLEISIERLRNAIARINRTSRARFRETFAQVNEQFQKVFPRFFNGGRAHLALTEGEEVLEAGIEITAQPPGKKLQNLNLLSGGEKALTALALLVAVFIVKPSPFFLLDEVDAALDDANVDRFSELLREMANSSQFLVITHNKGTIQVADTLFGVTMEEPGLSKLVTVDLVS